MARIHDTITLNPNEPMPSLGILMGSRVSSDVFDSINARGHSSYFGSEFDHMTNEFFNQFIKPMDQLNLDLGQTLHALTNPDRFRILDSIEAFRNVPASMELAIAMFEPVRQGILQGRMESFGYDPETFGEDIFGRYISNFACEDVAEASDNAGYYDISATVYSDDPEISDDDLYSIRKTREYILNHILAETDRDPCSIDSPRG